MLAWAAPCGWCVDQVPSVEDKLQLPASPGNARYERALTRLTSSP
jgi:hypothetical protein